MILYNQFASRVNFFEFTQDEFYPPHFKPENYEEELNKLTGEISTDMLVRELETSPRIFDIAEEFFQLKRFTNTQYVHFLFDISKLNSTDIQKLVRHAQVSMLNFENGIENTLFKILYDKAGGSDIDGDATLLKRAVVNYVATILKNQKGREHLYRHIANSVGARFRIATYFVENLHAAEHFPTADLKKFLSLKRIPRDGKGIHGKYGMSRIKKVFEALSLTQANNLFKAKALSANQINYQFPGWSYVTEKMISGVSKRKDGKLKKFDFIILKDGIPAYCIETNFYSTTGTKIGINIGEYTDLREDINALNRTIATNLKFCWVTDGNHWLSAEGEFGFNDLKSRYFTEDWELLNYNLLAELLPSMLK